MACTHSVRTALTTSVGQYLDTDFNFLFKHNYADIFITEVKPKLKGKGLSARDRRVLVTRIVAKAHSLTMSAGNAKRHEVFKKIGYLPADRSNIKLRGPPSYTFVPMSQVKQDV